MSTWVALEPLSATAEAGREAVVWLNVSNTGDLAEEYHVDVVGDPAQWCSVEPASFRLHPGTDGAARLTFTPPRSPATAGPRPYSVRVRSAEAPDGIVALEGVLSVIASADIYAELVPETVRGWRYASPQLVLDNYGETTVAATVEAATPGNGIDVGIRPPSFQIPPGRSYFSGLKLRPEHLLWLGPKVSHPFTATVRPSGSAPPTSVQGTYVQSAFLPVRAYVLGPLLVALLSACLTVWLLAKPGVSADATTRPEAAPATSMTVPSPHASSASHKASAPTATPPARTVPPPSSSAPSSSALSSPATVAAAAPPVSVPEPAGWWKLSETSGATAADTVGASAATGANVTWCATQSCAVFNGTDADLVTSGPVLNTGPGSSFTVAAWAWLSNASTGFGTLVSQDGTSNSAFYLQYLGASNDSWGFARVSSEADGFPAYRALSNGPAAAETWTFVVGVFNGATDQLELYVNGAPQRDVVTDPTPYATDGDLAIGRAQWAGGATNWYPGYLKNVEVWNTALSGAQIKQLSEDPS